MSFALSSQDQPSGPVSVWRQSYVSEYDISYSGAKPPLACEVELIVRDFFESDEVEVEDLTVIVCYARESRAQGEFGVYTTGVLLRGYPLRVPSEQLVSWSPSVSTPVHKLVSSEIYPVRSQVDMLGAFATVKDVFDEDDTAVYVQQFFRSSLRKVIMSRVVFERSSVDDTFRKTKGWAGAEVAGTPDDSITELKNRQRKRKSVSSGHPVVKKAKVQSTVSWNSTQTKLFVVLALIYRNPSRSVRLEKVNWLFALLVIWRHKERGCVMFINE